MIQLFPRAKIMLIAKFLCNTFLSLFGFLIKEMRYKGTLWKWPEIEHFWSKVEIFFSDFWSREMHKMQLYMKVTGPWTFFGQKFKKYFFVFLIEKMHYKGSSYESDRWMNIFWSEDAKIFFWIFDWEEIVGEVIAENHRQHQ